MNIEVRKNCDGVDWMDVRKILKSVGMSYHESDAHRMAFEASMAVVFVFHAEKLVGFGRAISDGIYQAAVYDCAVLPEFQGKGIGKKIMKEILSMLPTCNFILYASPGKEGFYEKTGFRKMKTGMACFQKRDYMRDRGFTE